MVLVKFMKKRKGWGGGGDKRRDQGGMSGDLENGVNHFIIKRQI